MNNKYTFTVSVIAFFILIWSVWFFISHPRYFKSPVEINKFCIEDPIQGIAHNSEYCIGYEEGLRAGWEEKETSLAIQEFEKCSKGGVENCK